jgi:hypothetical protein
MVQISADIPASLKAALEERAYQIKGSGRVSEAPSDAGAPFAVVTWFDAGIRCLFWRNTLQLSASAHHPFWECAPN